MKKYFYIFLAMIFSLSAAGMARAAGEEPGADFSSLKEYRGAKYTIIYPGRGYDRQLAVLAKRLDKIIPFVESYGSFQIKHIRIIITENTNQLQGGKEVFGEIRQEGGETYIDLPAAYYNENVVVHEVCHAAQIPLWVPSWFGEGHAENCARRYYESAGEYDRAKVYDNFYGDKIQRLKNVHSEVPQWIGEKDLGYNNIVSEKTILASYLLMDELLKTVSMAKILPKMKQDFVIDKYGAKEPYAELLPNDAIICKINEISPKNIIPLFEKYGFTIKCNEKTYDFLKESRQAITIGFVVAAAAFILVPFYLLVYLPIRFLYRRYKKRHASR